MISVGDFGVHIEHDFMTGGDKLWIAQRRHDGTASVLAEDGTWRTVADGVQFDFDPPRFPRGALAAIAEVVKPGATEANRACACRSHSRPHARYERR